MTIALRTGLGLDVHPFCLGRPLVLCGVTIPFERGLAGHSDADVAVHALMDALLGAAGLPDIGQRFPDSDPRCKDARSLELLQQVWADLAGRGYRLANLDLMILAERPRLAPHIPAMRANLAGALAAAPDQIGLKATTTERLGFVGREEGLAALASVLLERGAPDPRG